MSVSSRHEPNRCVVRFVADCGVIFQEPLSTFVDAEGAVRICALVIVDKCGTQTCSSATDIGTAVRTERWRTVGEQNGVWMGR